MPPLKASKVRIHTPLGITQDLPCNFGEARILMVLDPTNGSRPYMVSLLVLGQFLAPWSPWVPSKTGPRGPPIAPTDHRTPKDRNGIKGTYIIKSPKNHQDPKKAQKAMESNFIKIHHRRGHSPRSS
ncbi:hypothetical protein O181_126996 [Austropuccinia psidii MF-1]|uniref:Uncharacterized protein n=1 Tax=Austropuccinia psidii MF-1 TaxID=1389203 RepID=A0A9Q3KVB8_9BASI|nr:hypothetical protein [Austropuccinia psidii MF-1]